MLLIRTFAHHLRPSSLVVLVVVREVLGSRAGSSGWDGGKKGVKKKLAIRNSVMKEERDGV